MNLEVGESTLNVRLSVLEKIISVHGSFEIKIQDIAGIGTALPKQTWQEIRLPGTFLPGVVKAGTYYSKRGKEFWCLVRGRPPLCIELKNNSYKRLILGAGDDPAVEFLRRAVGI